MRMHHVLRCRAAQCTRQNVLPKSTLHPRRTGENLAQAQAFVLSKCARQNIRWSTSILAGSTAAARSRRVEENFGTGKWNSSGRVWRTVSAGAALPRVMPITKVIQDGGAVTIFGVTKLDHFSELPPLQAGATFDVRRVDAKLRARSGIEHVVAGAGTLGDLRRRKLNTLLPGCHQSVVNVVDDFGTRV